MQTQHNTTHTHRSSSRAQRQQLDYFLKAHWQKKKMLQRYERGNENFTSGESYRKSNKVRLQVRRTEWNITPHNQHLPDQYSSHRRDQLPGFVLLPSVCLSKREENWNPCSSSYCAQLISRTLYARVVLAAGGFAPPPRRTSHIREIKKSARFRRGEPNPTALIGRLNDDDSQCETRPEGHRPAVTNERRNLKEREERGFSL